MWELRAAGRVRALWASGRPVSFREYLALLEADESFAAWYTDQLAACEATAFFWEHPPLTEQRLADPTELVLIDGPALASLEPDPRAFREQFTEADVAVFENLGGDAILIAPSPVGPPQAYGHLAAFLREAPRAQVIALWQEVGRTARETIGTTPRWLSTAGMGVAWLHVRLDMKPKYYRHEPYRSHR